MVHAFVNQFSKSMAKTITSISQSSLKELKEYSWPGNVRELRNVVERAMILARGTNITIELPQVVAVPAVEPNKMEDAERDHVVRVLKSTGWRIQGAGGAAEILGLKRTTLESRMRKLGIRRPNRS